MSDSRETAPEKEMTDIVEWVFSQPPKEKKSIDLSLTPESADQFSSEEDREVMALEIFSQIAIMGCQKLFSEKDEDGKEKPFSLLQMTKEQLALLQKYMNSMGVQLIITCNEDRADPWEVAASQGMEAIKQLRLAVDFI